MSGILDHRLILVLLGLALMPCAALTGAEPSLVVEPVRTPSEKPVTAKYLTTLTKHDGQVRSVAFSPDGKKLASASFDKTVKLWDTEGWQELTTFVGHTDGVIYVTFSPDGKTLATSGRDDQIILWDVATGQQRTTISADTWSVAFSPNGRTLAWADRDKTIKLWDLGTGQQRATLAGHTDVAESVAYSPDGRKLASSSKDNTVRVWDAETNQQLATLKGHTAPVWFVAISPDGKTLASASDDGTVKLWDVQTFEERATLAGHNGWVGRMAFSPDGKTLATSSVDATVKLWDLETLRERATLRGHDSEVRSVAISPNGALLASAGREGTIRIWDPRMLVVDLYVLPEEGDPEELLAFIRDLKQFRPRTDPQRSEYEKRGKDVLKTAAQKILDVERDKWSKPSQAAIRILLEHRVDKLTNDSPAQRRETVHYVRMLLAAKLERTLEPEDANVAVLAVHALEETEDTELTLEACRSFAEMIEKANSDQLSEALKSIEETVRRLRGNDEVTGED